MTHEKQGFPGSGYPAYATMLNMLTRPEAFPVALPDDKPVTAIQRSIDSRGEVRIFSTPQTENRFGN